MSSSTVPLEIKDDKTKRLFFHPAVQKAKEQAKRDLATRTATAVAECDINPLYSQPQEIHLPPSAGSWERHDSYSGIALTRGFGEILTIQPDPGRPGLWSVHYSEPFTQVRETPNGTTPISHPDENASENASSQEEGPQ